MNKEEEFNLDEFEFNLESFVRKIEKGKTLSNDQVRSHSRTCEVFRMIMDKETTTPEILQSCTIQELEWVFDMVAYWPSWEGGSEDADWNHTGVQHCQVRDVVMGISRKKSMKKKVTFI